MYCHTCGEFVLLLFLSWQSALQALQPSHLSRAETIAPLPPGSRALGLELELTLCGILWADGAQHALASVVA